MHFDYTPKDVERFWSHVDRQTTPDGCWPCSASIHIKGWAQIRWGQARKLMLAHRVSYLLAYGGYPDDLSVLHSCDTPNCVNPMHLFLGNHNFDKDRSAQDRDRFWSYVDRSGGKDACWLWRAGTNHRGYGVISWQGRKLTTHRVSWMIAYGAIPKGLEICHDCPGGDNKLCVNPAHLYLGTHTDNMRDVVTKHQLKNPVRGVRHWNNKLTDAQVDEIRRRFAAGERPQQKLADEFGVSQAHISAIVRYAFRKLPS